MGEITKSETLDGGKVVVQISMDYSEFLNLKGNFKNIHIFSEDLIDVETNLSTRGKNGSTKYFLIPKKLRCNASLVNGVNCQKHEINNSIYYIYVLKKFL